MSIVTMLPLFFVASFLFGQAFPNSRPRLALYASGTLFAVACLGFVLVRQLLR